MTKIREVYLSHAARSKTFRILSIGRVKDAVEDLDGQLWEKDGIYHLVTPEGSVIVFSMNAPRKAVVITLHSKPHYDYRSDHTFEEVEEVEYGG